MTGKSLLLDSFGRILNGFDSRFSGFSSLLDSLLHSFFNLFCRLLLVVRKTDAFEVVGEVEGDALAGCERICLGTRCLVKSPGIPLPLPTPRWMDSSASNFCFRCWPERPASPLWFSLTRLTV